MHHEPSRGKAGQRDSSRLIDTNKINQLKGACRPTDAVSGVQRAKGSGNQGKSGGFQSHSEHRFLVLWAVSVQASVLLPHRTRAVSAGISASWASYRQM